MAEEVIQKALYLMPLYKVLNYETIDGVIFAGSKLDTLTISCFLIEFEHSIQLTCVLNLFAE